MAARARGDAALTTGWKVGLGVLAGVIALGVGLRILHSLTGGTPGGPRSSSYATGRDGLGAYAELVARAGHRVRRLRETAAKAGLRPDETAVLLDASLVSKRDARALAAFVRGGGRLVAGGAPSGWLAPLLATGAPQWKRGGGSRARVLAPVAEVRGVDEVRTARDGVWSDAGAALPVLGGSGGALLVVANVGRGRALLLADASPLQNRLLGDADDAALGLALAGARERPVVFLESYHGYGHASGLGAIPAAWWACFALALAATLAFMLARGRRLGPPEEAERELPPPRVEYVESLGGVLARTAAKRRAAAVEPVRARVRSELARRAALGPQPSEEELRRAGRAVGLDEDELAAVLAGADTDAAVVAAGRALARVQRESRA